MTDIKGIEKKITPILKRNDVEFAGVFGSYARGEAKENSDIDIIVRFSAPKGFFGLIGLERELSETLGIKVDLGTEGTVHPLIVPDVKKDLKVIYGQRQAI
jgi:uncharacterized protein